MKLRICFLLIAMVLATSPLFAADEVKKDPPATEVAATKAEEAKVSIEASDTKASEVIESLRKQSSEKLLAESSVKGTLTLTVKDVTLEPALTAVCKSGKFVWRKLYISAESKLLEQPDKLASMVRLMSGLSFPDMVLAGSSTGKVGVHFEDKTAVGTAEENATKKLGMVKVYLISNDAAISEKTVDKSKDSALDQFKDSSKRQMDLFMKMTPEEREAAIMESINMMDQVGPEYMASAMQAVMKMDPESMNRIQSRQMDMLFSMPESDRRALMKMQMQMQMKIPPEQQQLLMEDAKAIMEEMKNEQGNQ